MKTTEVINYIYKHRDAVNEIFNRDIPALVEIRSKWSGGSHLMDLIIYKIEQEYCDEINIVRIELESNKELFDCLEIDRAPALLLINKGQIIEIIKETVSKKNLEKILCNLIRQS
jgi:thioredoxin-like negative regulator of GroEL